jgi:N-acetylglucosaminyldiphosphoundecaprenol N-acetyl-beta-D-mannosaminyltransferase
VTLDSAVEEVSGWVARGEHRYVCVTGVHGVMESQRDPQLLRIHNRSGLTTPDGMPMVWSARWAGRREVSRVYGPDLMLAMLARAVERGWSSFFYGGDPGTAELLAGSPRWCRDCTSPAPRRRRSGRSPRRRTRTWSR